MGESVLRKGVLDASRSTGHREGLRWGLSSQQRRGSRCETLSVSGNSVVLDLLGDSEGPSRWVPQGRARSGPSRTAEAHPEQQQAPHLANPRDEGSGRAAGSPPPRAQGLSPVGSSSPSPSGSTSRVMVLMIRSSGNRKTPSELSNSEAARAKWWTPLRLILGSSGCKTITQLSTGGTEMQAASLKHLPAGKGRQGQGSARQAEVAHTDATHSGPSRDVPPNTTERHHRSDFPVTSDGHRCLQKGGGAV